MTDLDASVVGEPPPPYMIFLLVFLFFGTGLLGFLVCHLLKKKGYRCRAGGEEDEEEDVEEKLPLPNDDDEEEDNQDTVEQILKCIIENEANMEAFKEMLGNQNVCERHDPRLLRKESLGGIPPHHHTVHSGSDHNSCHLCVQGRSKKARHRIRPPRPKARPGEQTVFSVGRFRVIHTDKKSSLQGSTNLQSADSGDQLDQSEAQDSEKGEEPQQKEGYNLRNMFKDVKQPESTNGVVPSAMKRKKSLTLFSLRRASDPQGAKVTIQPMVKEERYPTRVPPPPLLEEADLLKQTSSPTASQAPTSTPSPAPKLSPTPALASTRSHTPALASTPSPTPALASTTSLTPALACTRSPTPALASTPSFTNLSPTLGHGSTTQSLSLTPTSPRLLAPSPPSARSLSPASPPAPASSPASAQSLLTSGTPQSPPSSTAPASFPAPATSPSPASFPDPASSPAPASFSAASPSTSSVPDRSLASTLSPTPVPPPPLLEEADLLKQTSSYTASQAPTSTPSPAPKLSLTPALASTPSLTPALASTPNLTPTLASTRSPTPALASTPSPTPALASTHSPTPALALSASPSPALASTPSPTNLSPTLGHGSTTQSLSLTPTSQRLLAPSPPSARSLSPASLPAPASSPASAQSLPSPSSASAHSLTPGTPQSPASSPASFPAPDSFPAPASFPAPTSSPAPAIFSAAASDRPLASTLSPTPATPPAPASSSTSAPVSPRLRLDTKLASARVSPSLSRASLTPEEPNLQARSSSRAQDYRHSPSPGSYSPGSPSPGSGSVARPGQRSSMDQGLQGVSLTSDLVGLASPSAGEEGVDSFKSGKLPHASGMPPGRQPPSPCYPASPSSPLVGSLTIVKASPDSTREFSVFRMVELEEEGSTGAREGLSRGKEELCMDQREEPVKGEGLSGMDLKSSTKKQEPSALTTATRETIPEAPMESPGGEGEGPKAAGEEPRDDMVQMEDIRGCRVSQGEEPESVEEKRSSVLTQQNKF